MTDILQRLRERKLGQWALAYATGAWVALQGMDLIGHQFDWPAGVLRGITVAAGVGVFATLVLAWYHGERGAQKICGTDDNRSWCDLRVFVNRFQTATPGGFSMRMVFLSIFCIASMAGCGQASNDAAPTPAAHTSVATPAPADTDTPGSANATADTNSTSVNSTSDADASEEAPQTSMQLTPLSKDDIALYLQVMHAAADRVQHPTAADTATLARYKAIMKGADSGGKNAPPSTTDMAVMENGTLIEQQMDMLVVRERHIDEKRYNGISSAIEDVIPNPTMEVAGGATGEGAPVGLPQLSGESLALQQKIHAAETQDTAILVPYRSEVQKLLAIVRNPRRMQ